MRADGTKITKTSDIGAGGFYVSPHLCHVLTAPNRGTWSKRARSRTGFGSSVRQDLSVKPHSQAVPEASHHPVSETYCTQPGRDGAFPKKASLKSSSFIASFLPSIYSPQETCSSLLVLPFVLACWLRLPERCFVYERWFSVTTPRTDIDKFAV